MPERLTDAGLPSCFCAGQPEQAASLSTGASFIRHPFHLSGCLAFLMLLNLAAVTDRMVFGALAPVLQASLRLDDVALALVQGPAFGIPYAAALPTAGWLVDRVGMRRALAGSVLLWIAGLLVSAGAGSVPLLVAGRAITGAGQAVLTPAAFAAILATAAPGTAGRSLTLFTGAGTVGRSIAFVAAGGLLWLFGGSVRVAPWSATLMTLAAATSLLLAVGMRRLPAGVPAAREAAWRVTAAWLRGAAAPVAVAVVAALGPVMVAQALAAWVAVVVVRTQGVDATTAALGIGAVGLVVGPLSHVLGGAIADGVWLRRRAAPLAALLAIPGAAAFAHAPTLSLALAALAATQLVSGATGALGLVRVQQLIPAPVRGTANGLFMTLVALVGVSGGPMLVPLLAGIGGGIGGGLVLLVALATAASVAAMLAGDQRPGQAPA